MGLFDKVKKILFDEEEIEDLPVRTDKVEKEETSKRVERVSREEEKGGVIFHNDEDDTITEVKVPEETPRSFAFPVMMDDEEEEKEEVQELPKRETIHREQREEINDTQSLRLNEDEFDRTKEIERLREQRSTKTKEDLINEYNESRRIQRESMEQSRREVVEPKRDYTATVEKKEHVPYKVPPVISPVFGILDKNYDPDNYEESRQKITLSNAGNTSAIKERQFGPVSYNDQGIPTPKYQSSTIIIATTEKPKDIKEELKKENEAAKITSKIEEEIINNIINDHIATSTSVEDAFDDTTKIEEIHEDAIEDITEEIPKPKVRKVKVTKVEEPTIEYAPPVVEEEDEEVVITGSPYDSLFEDEEEIKPTKDINDLIEEQEEVEEANITPDKPKNIEDNADLDDTIETDLYNLIDSMYKDDE